MQPVFSILCFLLLYVVLSLPCVIKCDFLRTLLPLDVFVVFGVSSIHMAVQNLCILLKTTVTAIPTEILSKCMEGFRFKYLSVKIDRKIDERLKMHSCSDASLQLYVREAILQLS